MNEGGLSCHGGKKVANPSRGCPFEGLRPMVAGHCRRLLMLLRRS